MELEQEINKFLMEKNVLRIGIATQETLAGGPTSADLRVILPNAESAICFALPLDKQAIREFLSKKDYRSHVLNNIEVNSHTHQIALNLAEWLQKKGFSAAVPPAPGEYAKWATTNVDISKRSKFIYRLIRRGIRTHRFDRIVLKNFRGESKFNIIGTLNRDIQYRQDVPNWREILPPYLSHRYIAIRSGVGSLGWSGVVGIKDVGAGIILGSVVTSAKLHPTEPIPETDSFCDKCKLCIEVCPTKMMVRDQADSVTLGGEKFTCSMRKSLMHCQIACSGLSGLSNKGKWSSWSPGRYLIPEEPNEMIYTLAKAFFNQKFWPINPDPQFQVPIKLSCANCQLICFGNPKETATNYKMLINSGCVIQNPKGDYVVLPPEEAERQFQSFPKKHQDLYH